MFGPRLHAALLERGDGTKKMVRFIESPQAVGVRCSLPGWLQRVEFTDLKQNFRQSFSAYEHDIGRRCILLDSWGENIVGGWVYEVVPDGRHVHYIGAGAWKRGFDQYEANNPTSTDDWTTFLTGTVITDHWPALSTDFSNVVTANTSIGNQFAVNSTTGTRPGDIVKTVLEMSNTTSQTYDFWIRELPPTLLQAQKPVIHVKPRTDTDSITWQVNRADLTEISISRHIWDLENDTVTHWGSAATATAAATNSTSQSTYWSKSQRRLKPQLNSTAGAQHRDERQTVFFDPVQQASFTIGSKWILGGTTGAKWPLWYALRAPGYIRISDLEPDVTLFDKSRDRKSVFWTAALDYDGDSKTLVVTPDQPSTRLDAVLAREANVSEAKGEIIQRQMRHRMTFAMPGMMVRRD